LVLILAVLAPLLACAVIGRGEQEVQARAAHRFVLSWLVAAMLGLLLLGTYLHHYLLPVLVPLAAAAAAGFGSRNLRAPALAVLAVAFIVSETMMLTSLRHHGTRRQFDAIAAYIDPAGCLYVYSGEPAFYGATSACIPTRFAFPSHLARLEEAHALGTDPLGEVARIMASAPTTVIIAPPYGDENWAARQIVLNGVARDYRLALRQKLGRDEVEVFRRNTP
jgi:hypothetical protein